MSEKTISPERVRHKSIAYCCVSGCKINSKSNPDIVFHVLNENITFYNVSNSSLRQKLQICNEHYFSNQLLTLKKEQFSDFPNPITEEKPPNFDLLMTSTYSTIGATLPDMPSLDDEECLTTNNQEICGICFSGGKFKNILTDLVNDIPIFHMLQKFCFLNIPKLPEMLCEDCLKKLCISYDFQQQLENYTKNLRNDSISDSKVENNAPEINKFEKKNIVKKPVSNRRKKKYIIQPQDIEKDKKLIVSLKNLTSKDIKTAKNRLKTQFLKSVKTKTYRNNNHISLNSPEDLKLRLEKALIRANPFLTKVEVNDDIKIRKNPHLKKKKRGRPMKLENLKKNRILSLTSGEIKKIFEMASDNNVIDQDALIATPPFGDNLLAIETMAYPCQSCNKVFLNYEMLELHECDGESKVELILEQKAVKCQICNQTFSNFQLLIKHTCFAPVCNICSLQFRTKKALDDHKIMEHDNVSVTRKFKCKLCGKNYRHGRSLSKHIKMKHSIWKPLGKNSKLPKNNPVNKDNKNVS